MLRNSDAGAASRRLSIFFTNAAATGNETQPMKTYFNKIAVVGLICALGAALSMGPTAFAAEKAKAEKAKGGGGDAKLMVYRSPKLGTGTTISVSVDGKKVGSVVNGNYNGPLPAGKHTLSVAFDPARGSDKPAKLDIDAIAGQTYGFTATIAHGDLVLTKSSK